MVVFVATVEYAYLSLHFY
ncbi:hypothetical protein ACMXLN_003346 [Escherichia coli]|nr:hypothetical protein [Escherichia coli]MDD6115814.1 hypothetical protein [Escherichia coli]MDE7999374.1 hypothetical protein [Escherichia coli]MDF0902865.1 hypothetical protein [Escherichia coli]MDF3915796.1 hypothetical protein [Escherichia coli]MDF8407124.1 hypothetical protein [Escherichia coli]